MFPSLAAAVDGGEVRVLVELSLQATLFVAAGTPIADSPWRLYGQLASSTKTWSPKTLLLQNDASGSSAGGAAQQAPEGSGREWLLFALTARDTMLLDEQHPHLLLTFERRDGTPVGFAFMSLAQDLQLLRGPGAYELNVYEGALPPIPSDAGADGRGTAAAGNAAPAAARAPAFTDLTDGARSVRARACVHPAADADLSRQAAWLPRAFTRSACSTRRRALPRRAPLRAHLHAGCSVCRCERTCLSRVWRTASQRRRRPNARSCTALSCTPTARRAAWPCSPPLPTMVRGPCVRAQARLTSCSGRAALDACGDVELAAMHAYAIQTLSTAFRVWNLAKSTDDADPRFRKLCRYAPLTAAALALVSRTLDASLV